MTFIPSTVTVTQGTIVRWSNRDLIPHTTTSDTGLWDWSLVSGGTFAVRFLAPGTYAYHCELHRAMGMVGTVVVQALGTGPTPTPPPPAAPGEIVYAYFGDEATRAQTELFTIFADGTGRSQRTTTANLAEAQPSWSPDRHFVAYTAAALDRTGHPYGIHVMDVQTGASQRITSGPEQYEPDWKSDGSLIALTNITRAGNQVVRSEIAAVAPNGAGYRVLIRLDSGTYAVTNPSWSPDGQQLAFTLGSDAEGGELYIMNADGTQVRRLFTHPGWDDLDPEWSPDGRFITLSSGVQRGAATRHDIWVYDVARNIGGTVAQHTTWDLRRPAWSPDGQYLVFTAMFQPAPPRWALYVVPALGGPVSGPLAVGVEPDWSSPVRVAVPSATPSGSPSPVVPTPTATLGTPPVPPPFPTIPPPNPTAPGPTATDAPPPTFEPPEPTSTTVATAEPSPSATQPAAPLRHLWLPISVHGVRGGEHAAISRFGPRTSIRADGAPLVSQP